ncbi:hypothetical protein Zmor_021422 [Zophobas morio]|uniref:Uncharacterized protein n=1 Tax=Zophobas morio TaxID=2755281 RepID=A0AA38I664_9CUCU|nr:hypothetical protein Zmor_021422 [Zophobas morio]
MNEAADARREEGQSSGGLQPLKTSELYKTASDTAQRTSKTSTFRWHPYVQKNNDRWTERVSQSTMLLRLGNGKQHRCTLFENNEKKPQKLSPCSLWPEYSMLEATLKAKENIDIEKFGAVISYIKKLNVGYRGKKSNVLTREEIKTFLQEADDGEYLFEKVALIFGIAGACRNAELCAMRFDDIQDCGNVLNIVIPDSKTHKERRFSVVNEGFGVNTIDLYRRYVALRPINSPLSSATLLVNAGGDITSLKRHGGWESTNLTYKNLLEKERKLLKKFLEMKSWHPMN